MKLSNISVIFIIIVIPIILLLLYYITLQIDTLNMQTAYTSKQLSATKEAIEAFEINTVEWNEAYSETADSKRRDVMASINTFTTSFANSLGIGGTNKENILAYIPAIACTLYDGYYIYSPAETKEVIKDENGLTVFMTEDLAKEIGYNEENDKGKLLYEAKSNAQGTYTTNDGTSKSFTLNSNDAKSTYSHILKPYATYSARYKTDNIDITVNYTLDNYITIYGMVNGKNVIKSGYLTYNKTAHEDDYYELLKETLWYEGIEGNKPKEFTYVYAEDGTKVYFETDSNIQTSELNGLEEYPAFQITSTGKRVNLNDLNEVKYKVIKAKYSKTIRYQALNKGSINKTNEEGEIETIEIKQGYMYTDKSGNGPIKGQILDENDNSISNMNYDYSAINYYKSSEAFMEWIESENLDKIQIKNMQNVNNISQYGNGEDYIFNFDSEENDPENEDSVFVRHKNEIIKQCLISDLNQAITSYSRRNSEGEYQLPVLKEDDWNHVLRNVSIISFVQNLPIGMKYYNNYTVATSTINKEYVNPDEIYLSNTLDTDKYYHKPYCEKLDDSNLIGYRNIDYVVKSYNTENQETKEKETKYYYRHENIANQQCYYCLVQRNLYKEDETERKERAYKIALARERYVTHEFLDKTYDI